MSLRFKSELRLELRIRSCQAELMPAGWRSRPAAVASGTGEGAAALNAALSALRLADVDELPGTASLTVADEYLYYRLLDDELGWAEALQEASAGFSEDLGRDDLRVQVIPLNNGRRWIAAAVPEPDVIAWREALALAGVRLEHLHGALIEDLRLLAPQVPEDDAVIALLREEGMSLVHLQAGLPVALGWERFEASDSATMEHRLRAFVRAAAVPSDTERVVYLLPESKALCRYVWGQGQQFGLIAAPLAGARRADADAPGSGQIGAEATILGTSSMANADASGSLRSAA